MRPGLSHLLQYPGLRPAAATAARPPGIATGDQRLDALLHWRGWPAATLTELLTEPGLGEFSLVAPALARSTAAGGRVFLVAPPHLPCAQALAQAGLPADGLWVLRCPGSRDQLWAGEQILGSGSCAGLLLWEADIPWRHAQLLRLQNAARTASAPVFLYRRPKALHIASPAPLRIGLQGSLAGTRLIIHKQPGASGQSLPLAQPGTATAPSQPLHPMPPAPTTKTTEPPPPDWRSPPAPHTQLRALH